MKIFLKSLFLGVIIINTIGCNSAKKKSEVYSEKQPNIIFMMADDHTTQGLGIYKSRLQALNPTPNLDKVAKQGVIFDRCYVTNAICVPSRASIISGQYSQANGVIDLQGELPVDKQYLPKAFNDLGYETAIVGKWHLHAEPAAFDYYCVFPSQGKYFDPEFRVQGPKPWPENTIKRKGHSTDNVADLTINWLKNKRDKNKPFFLMPQFKAPHDDFEYAPRYENYLADTWIPEPSSMYDNKNNGSEATRGKNDSLTRIIGSSVSRRNLVRHQAMNLVHDENYKKYGVAQEIPTSDHKPFQWNDAERKHASDTYQLYLKSYLRCVKGVDDNFKRIMDYLESENLLENTIIMYTGDQGFMLGEHDYIDKRWMYEESMRMPLFVWGPKYIQKGQRSGALVNNTDFAPTMIDLAGGTPPSQMQGKSFKEILTKGKEPENWRKNTYYRYWMHMAHRHANPAHFGIRSKDYKLIFFYGRYHMDVDDPNVKLPYSWGNDYTRKTPVAWEFYDMKNDPNEMNNVYDDPKYAEIVKEMKQELKRLRADLDEGDENYPHIQKVIDAYWDL